jgi:hypothetical protein
MATSGTPKSGTVQPRADQPRVGTPNLQSREGSPSLTYRQVGYKNSGGRSQRDYARS